jgi:hypothetical protein
MARPRRVAIQQIAALLIAGLLLTLSLASSNASAAQPIARTASKPVATVTRSMLHIAMVDRAAAKRSLSHDIKRLKACKRARPRHCRHLRRTVRHARGRLAYASRRVNRLRAHLALAHRPAKQASPQSAPASTDFGQPFVKGVDTNIQGWGAAALPTIASEMSSLGVNWAREDLSWSDVESQKGVFDWSSFDKIVYDAQARGITILPIVGYAPSWSSPGDSADYAAFVKAAVERYGPGTRANLPWWELWNEPYFAYAWGNKTAEPAAYARDAVAAAEAAKGAAPSVKLLLAADYEDEKQVGSSPVGDRVDRRHVHRRALPRPLDRRRLDTPLRRRSRCCSVPAGRLQGHLRRVVLPADRHGPLQVPLPRRERALLDHRGRQVNGRSERIHPGHVLQRPDPPDSRAAMGESAVPLLPARIRRRWGQGI